MENVFITGCNGLLGQKLIQRFAGNFQVFAADIHLTPFLDDPQIQYFQLDITKRKDTVKLITEVKPQFILNAAAFTNVDGAEEQKELCWNVNVSGVENLVLAARKNHAFLVHVSTDYVFDGKNGPYRETDSPDALGYYGKSKLAAENIILGSSIKAAIARTMVLYGTGKNVRPNFVTWLISQLRDGKKVKIVDDQIGNSTLADVLADGIFHIVDQQKEGIFHLAGEDILSRYDFSLLIAEIFGLDQNLITRIQTKMLNQKSPRPLKSGFVLDKVKSELEFYPLNTRDSLRALKKQL